MARRDGCPRLPPRTFVAGYGGPDSTDQQDLTVVPPVAYRLRYGVTARGRLAPDPYVVDSVTVTDRNSGAVLTFEDGKSVAASLPADLDSRAVADLWRDARYLAGWARSALKPGPPPGQGLRFEHLVEAAIQGREPDGTWPTLETVAENIGKSARQVGRVAGIPGGWDAVIRRAQEIVSG